MSEFKSIAELFGKAKMDGTDTDKVLPSVFLDTGIPQLNSILTGDPTKGLPCGQITEISGESGSGKTMIASRLMINAQEQGGFAMFYDFERAYHLHLSVEQGLDTDPNKFFYKKAKYFEESLQDAVDRAKLIREAKAIPPEAPIVVIFDSFAAMIPKAMAADGKGKEKGIGDYTMNDMTSLSRTSSLCLKVFTIDVNDYNMCAVFLNQLASTMETHGPSKKTKGGNSLPFYASTRLFLRGTEVKDTTTKKIVGKEMTISTMKNRTRKPFESVQVDFNLTTEPAQFEVERTYINYLKSIGAIKGSGAWLTFEGVKYNGNKAFEEALMADPTTSVNRLVNCQLAFIAEGHEVVALVDEDLAKESEEDGTDDTKA